MKKIFPLLVLALVLLSTGCKKDPFTTDNSGTFKDARDNHEYPWVRIGDQIWMAQNAAYLPYVNPSTVKSTAEARSYVYGYQGTDITAAMTTSNYENYGGLYNFEAAKIACPDGWHLPTDEEWKTMELFLGMSQADAEKTGFRESGSLGTKLKATTAWGANQNTNSSGFNAIPSGYLGEITFDELMTAVVFWTATGFDAETAYDRYMDTGSTGIDRGPWPRSEGYSVRCVRN
ncbi:MAG: fibrobacter succinogenes major paralogous domain-containing protein [Bacteroidales bacterium]|jgi:uncharacterized protein (TIGR02145 family)